MSRAGSRFSEFVAQRHFANCDTLVAVENEAVAANIQGTPSTSFGAMLSHDGPLPYRIAGLVPEMAPASREKK
jgi:hypothetical protein